MVKKRVKPGEEIKGVFFVFFFLSVRRHDKREKETAGRQACALIVKAGN